MGKRRHDRIGQQGPEQEGPDQGGPAPDLVGEMAHGRLDQHVDQQRPGGDRGRRVLREARRVDQELRQVGRVGVERQRSRRGQPRHHQGLARMFLQQRRGQAELPDHQDGHRQAHGARIVAGEQRRADGERHPQQDHHPAHVTRVEPRAVGGLDLRERGALLQAGLDPEHHDGQHPADGEGNAPSPVLELSLGQCMLQNQQHQGRRELAHDQGHVLEAGPEPAAGLAGHLGHVGGAGAILAADGETLDDPRRGQGDGREHADGRVAGDDGDGEGAQAHQPHREGQRRAAADPVGVKAHGPGADRPGQEPDREDRRGLQKLGGPVALREEVAGEVEGEGGIGEPVVPFDQIARRPAEDSLDPRDGRHGLSSGHRDLSHASPRLCPGGC